MRSLVVRTSASAAMLRARRGLGRQSTGRSWSRRTCHWRWSCTAATAAVAQQLLILLLPKLEVARVPEAAHAARRPRDLPARGHVQSLRCLHIGGLGLVHQRELLELLDVEQRLEQPRLEDPDNPHDGGAQLPLVLLGVEACVVVLLTSSNFLSFYYVNPTGRDIIVPWMNQMSTLPYEWNRR